MHRLSRILLTAVFVFLTGANSPAATLPSGFTETQVASGLLNPTAMTFAPDGRLFVTQQGGALRIVKNGALLGTPFVSLTVNSSGERGLLGVAFDPDFANNNFLYLYYTTSTAPIHNRVSRFTANGDVMVAGSELTILELENLSATNHNGGALHFGPDGKLYVAVGENAVGSNAQALTNRLGKMLRINTDGSIPTDNPFYNTALGDNRAIWARGLRNPFTFAFQNGTGRMFINDVGQNTWEEVNDGLAGANYGWPTCEGICNNAGFVEPLFAYGHGSSDTTGCAITGGAFYNPTTTQFPASYTGKYFFADYCSGWIRVYDPVADTAAAFATGLSFPVDLQVSSDGGLYYLMRGTGSNTGVVGRIAYPSSNLPPTFTQMPMSQIVAVGQTAAFSVSATGSTPISYQWRRNNVDLAGANSASYTTPPVVSGDNGSFFQCYISNAFGNALSDAATLTVASNTPPTGTILTPVAGTFYSGGQTISFSGSGTDLQDGTLLASAFTWTVNFHHADHTHPVLLPTSGITAGSFNIPTTGETATTVFYRIELKVRDSAGLEHLTTRDVLPRTVTLSLATSAGGLGLTLDGQPVTATYSFTAVVGMLRSIGAPTPQVRSNGTYDFASWSDGGAATHTITVPLSNTTYTATFTKRRRNPR